MECFHCKFIVNISRMLKFITDIIIIIIILLIIIVTV